METLGDTIFRNIVKDSDNYLKPDNTFEINYLRRIRNLQYQQEQDYKRNHSFIDSEYNKIIDDTAKIIKELGFKNNHTSYFSVFSYLLWNGMFSNNQRYTYSLDTFDILGYFGLDVINGMGNCKSNSDMMNRVFRKLGLDSYFLINSCDIKSIDSIIDVKRSNSEKKKNIDDNVDTSFIIGNHANVLVEDSDTNNFYIYDPTNLLIHKTDNSKEATVCNGDGKCFIKPWGLILREYMGIDEVLELLDCIDNQDKSLFMNNKDIKDIAVESVHRCKKEKTLVLDFYNNINKNIKNINDNIYF